MRSLLFIAFLLPFLFSCSADQQHARPADTSGLPPSAARKNVTPPDVIRPDTIMPDSTPVEVAPEEIPAKSEQAPRPDAMHKPRATAPMVSSPAPGFAGAEAAKGFVDIQVLEPSIRLDIRYATTNNFTQSQIYDCPRCLLRPEAAQAIVRAHRLLQRQGMGLKLFDCYRPQPYQQRLWDKVPNPDYVTPPDKGSMHSRGAAVDLTIVDAQGNELDMGTPYDFFGPEAHYTYTRLPGKVLANRRLLRRTMENAGLQGIRTEWWHFSYQSKEYPLSDWVWDCTGK